MCRIIICDNYTVTFSYRTLFVSIISFSCIDCGIYDERDFRRFRWIYTIGKNGYETIDGKYLGIEITELTSDIGYPQMYIAEQDISYFILW